MRVTRLIPLMLAAFAWQASAQVPEAPSLEATSSSTAIFGEPITGSALQTLRGGTNTVTTVNDMWLNGTTSSNSASQVATGSNAISSGSFANLNGIPIVIQNTGANVLIQNAVILNLQMN